MVQLRRLAVLATLLCAAASHAGLKISYQLKRKEKTSLFTLQVEGKSARVEMAEDGAPPKGAFIRDGEGKRILVVHHEEKAYTEFTDEQMRRMKAQLEQAKARMSQQMASLPPEKRKQMEAILDGQGKMMMEVPNAEERYFSTKISRKVAGYSCTLYAVEVKGNRVAEACLIPWSELKVDREQIQKSLEALKGGMPAGSFETSDAKMKAWGAAEGLPAWRHETKAGEEESEALLVSLTTVSVPREAFAPPAGYTKRTPGMR